MFKYTQTLIFFTVINFIFIIPVIAHPNHILDDTAIIAILDQIHSVDVQTSQVGLDKTVTQEVRELSQLLQSFHKTARLEMRTLVVQQKMVEADSNANRNIGGYAETISTLRSLPNLEFDKKFLEHELAFHIKAKYIIKKSLLKSSANKLFKKYIENLIGKIESVTTEIRKIQNAQNAKSKISKVTLMQ